MTGDTKDSLGIDAVLSLAAQGWRLLPCQERSKKPQIAKWPERASMDPKKISAWARKYLRCNWALATGPGSGVWVLDIDGDEGKETLAKLIEQHGDWVLTRTAHTGSGCHQYFKWPGSDLVIRNNVKKLGPGLDVRGDGGYVIIPPSVHPNGLSYEWDNDYEVATAPAWLLEKVATQEDEQRQNTGVIFTQGHRNDSLMRIAFSRRRKGKQLAEIEKELLEISARRCQPSLPEAEVRKIAQSVCKYPVGGLDPLEKAWEVAKVHASKDEQFLELARELQRVRPRQAVALPLKRIAELIGVEWHKVRDLRNKAVKAGEIELARAYVRRKSASEYRVRLSVSSVTTPPHHQLYGDMDKNDLSLVTQPDLSLVTQNHFVLGDKVVEVCDKVSDKWPTGQNIYVGYFHDEVRHEGESDGEYKHAARSVQTRAEAEMAEGRAAVGQHSH
jgi:hypothetical protein